MRLLLRWAVSDLSWYVPSFSTHLRSPVSVPSDASRARGRGGTDPLGRGISPDRLSPGGVYTVRFPGPWNFRSLERFSWAARRSSAASGT